MFEYRFAKLIHCSSRDSRRTELFVVEGDSAANAVAGNRDLVHQAVLPMQGKPLNAWKAPAAKVLQYPLFIELSQALGVPMIDTKAAERGVNKSPAQGSLFSSISNDSPTAAPNYDRLLLLFDPDADGIHCGALLLMFLYRWMRPLLASGSVEMVRPPLFQIRYQDLSRQVIEYAYFSDQCRARCDELKRQGITTITSQHYRGLGSIDPDVLSTTCIRPGSRSTHIMREADGLEAISVFAA
jgi:DNA gyrase subunit B